MNKSFKDVVEILKPFNKELECKRISNNRWNYSCVKSKQKRKNVIFELNEKSGNFYILYTENMDYTGKLTAAGGIYTHHLSAIEIQKHVRQAIDYLQQC